MTSKLSLACVMVLLTAAAPLVPDAMAQDKPDPGQGDKLLRQMDRELEEMRKVGRLKGQKADVDAIFQLIDENGDGVIDRTEWRLRNMRLLAIRDTDGDGKLSREEVPGIGQDAFDAADTNGDGFLSGLELNQADFMQFDSIDSEGKGAVDIDAFRAFEQTLN